MAKTFDQATAEERRALAALQLIVFDVDGVMTDGRFTLDADGNESKTFNTQDGYGMRRLLDNGVAIAVITGRNSNAVTVRMQELGVQHVFQGCRNKSDTIQQLLTQLGIAPTVVAAVGDDEPDLAMFDAVATRVCVANAVASVQSAADWVTQQRGGFGAVREIADCVLAARQSA